MIDALAILAVLILVLYTAWQLFSLAAWRRVVRQPAPDSNSALPTIALLVPFRNEAENLPALAASLLAQDYSGGLELIFIDDHSSDHGATLLPAGVTLLHLADYLKGKPVIAHKKAALTYAITSTEADVIITTDADCYWPADRVSCIAAAFAAGADVVLGPVLIAPADSFCNAYQALDMAAYQFLTAATARQGRPALANGANFAFRRQLFNAVGGYQGVDHLPSGDDVLLLHKFYQPDLWPATKQVSVSKSIAPPVTHYVAGAAVTTRPVNGWLALWRQRLRWAGKAGNYNNAKLSFAQALAFSLSAAIVISFISLPLHLRPRLVLVLWAGKALIDLICLWPVMIRFGQNKAMKWYPLASVVYPFFLFGVGTAALLGFTVKWKGRH
ncbi:glycosyltransferase [Neolewinella aurantiaca]|uniref:Glycosyltransferase n=1 Tax=Neolewinella aurantiaca TaxID=2602767 RepID=A0A5C7FF88_9BACT|nr:glycosyltransferase [Neolewinella aurantiaca]TXF88900.1 glycosyltransferase [Neolewinella aurantiaca]